MISHLRHLTHKFVDNYYCPHLCSFSVGQENERRIIIGSTIKLVRCSLPYACIHDKLFSTYQDLGKIINCICSQRISLLLTEDLEFASYMSAYQKKVDEDNAVDKKMSVVKEKSSLLRCRHKRPDKQLYVPRALRKTDAKNVMREDESAFNKAPMKHSQTTCMVPKIKKQNNDSDLPRHNPNNVKTNSNIIDILKVEHSNDVLSFKTADYSLQKRTMDCISDKSSNLVLNNNEQHIENINKNSDTLKIDIDIKETLNSNENINISENKINSESVDEMSTDCVKNTEINNEALYNDNDSLYNPINVIHVENGHPSENPEDSWETMFNDDGDCLDPKFIKELCDITGQIDLTVAKNDYSNYQTVSKNSVEEFENIVELYGFPVEFSTQDLTSAFSSFQASSYNIKWVDDCHALAIFSSPAVANQALHLSHPFIKIRPVSEGIKESKEKARFCARMFESPKPRPVTSAALARRLVSGALGLKVNASKEQRDIERNILREAKEKKKLKARQRQDIWNGIVS